MFLLGLAITLFGFVVFELLLSGDIMYFIDIPSLLFVLFPLVGVLTATQSFKVFYAGLRAAIFPKEEIPEEMRGRAASLFRLLSKVAVMAGAMASLICLTNMLMNLDFSDTGGWAALCIHLAIAMITLLYGVLLMVAVFEPVVFILKKRQPRQPKQK